MSRRVSLKKKKPTTNNPKQNQPPPKTQQQKTPEANNNKITQDRLGMTRSKLPLLIKEWPEVSAGPVPASGSCVLSGPLRRAVMA